MQKKALWIPDKDYIENSNMSKFRLFVNEKFKINLMQYDDLYDWSVNYPANFWQCLWEFFDIIHSKKYHSVLSFKDKTKSADDISNYRWFDGAKLNFAENLLRFNDDETAL